MTVNSDVIPSLGDIITECHGNKRRIEHVIRLMVLEARCACLLATIRVMLKTNHPDDQEDAEFLVKSALAIRAEWRKKLEEESP